MGIIEVTDVTRTYGRGKDSFTAVDGVSFEVAAGELVSVLGVNGAGKTSLVEVVEGIAPASTGSVRVLGHDPIGARAQVRPPHRHHVAGGGLCPGSQRVRDTTDVGGHPQSPARRH